MIFLSVYYTLVRVATVAFSLYHLYKKQYKILLSMAALFALTYLPFWLGKLFDVHLDVWGQLLYTAILVMTLYLGNQLKFYDRYSWWDRLIHFMSGIVFVGFGVAFAQKIPGLNRFHILFFCFTFSLALHIIWEVLEYAADCIFHSDNQRWQRVHPTHNHNPASAIQPAGLVDTMNDSIVCITGTVISCAIWWFVL